MLKLEILYYRESGTEKNEFFFSSSGERVSDFPTEASGGVTVFSGADVIFGVSGETADFSEKTSGEVSAGFEELRILIRSPPPEDGCGETGAAAVEAA